MTRNPNLVATPVVDKNGKATTVHKKASKYGDSASIPAPRAAKKVTPEEAFKEGMNRLTEAGVLQAKTRYDSSSWTHINLSELSIASPETMNEMVDHIMSAGEAERECWELALDTRKLCHTNPGTKAGSRNFRRIVLARMTIQPLVVQIAQYRPDYIVWPISENTIRPILQRQADRHTSGVIDEKLLKSEAIHIAVKLLNNIAVDTHDFTPADEAAVAFIKQNLEKVESVLGELVQRSTTEPDTVRQLIDTHTGLAEGAL